MLPVTYDKINYLDFPTQQHTFLFFMILHGGMVKCTSEEGRQWVTLYVDREARASPPGHKDSQPGAQMIPYSKREKLTKIGRPHCSREVPRVLRKYES